MIGKRSPWGKIDHAVPIGVEGITFVSTPGHGGYKLDRKRNAMIPADIRRAGGWYEEDLDWAIVVTFFPEAVPSDENRAAAKETLANWYPDFYEAHYGTRLTPGESHRRDEDRFNELNKENPVVIGAFGDWDEDVPKGWVRAIATRGGRRCHDIPRIEFLVRKEAYELRSRFGFVVDTDAPGFAVATIQDDRVLWRIDDPGDDRRGSDSRSGRTLGDTLGAGVAAQEGVHIIQLV